MAFGGLGRDERLFPLSPSAYRSRWDKCLKTLGLEGLVDVTPGGLRGGGAVAAYHCGGAIADIQWKLRLKHMGTLERRALPPGGGSRGCSGQRLGGLEASDSFCSATFSMSETRLVTSLLQSSTPVQLRTRLLPFLLQSGFRDVWNRRAFGAVA